VHQLINNNRYPVSRANLAEVYPACILERRVKHSVFSRLTRYCLSLLKSLEIFYIFFMNNSRN